MGDPAESNSTKSHEEVSRFCTSDVPLSPRPEIKIEMIQPKTEAEDIDEDVNLDYECTERADHRPELTSDDVTMDNIGDDDADSKSKLTVTVKQDSFACDGCGKSFKNNNRLKRHMKYCEKLDSDIVKNKCPICQLETKWKHSLQRHMKMMHPTDKIDRPVCSGCGKSLKNSECLKRHMKDCEKLTNEIVENDEYEAKYRPLCPGCGKLFKTKAILKQHTRKCEKLNDDIVKHKCPICLYETKWKNNFRKHIKMKHHIDEMGRPSCPGCGEFFKDNQTLQQHMGHCEKSNEIVKYKCAYCFYETKWKNCLRRHITMVHPIDKIDRPVCHGCGKSYKTDVHLKKHFRYCEKSLCQNSPFCHGCGKSYNSKENLKKHVEFCGKWNSEIVRHKCPICLYETKWKNNLMRHVRLMHPIGEIDPLVCQGCGKSFKTGVNLKKHLNYCGKWNDEIVKHKCSICLYETKWKNNLMRHIRLMHPMEIDFNLSEFGEPCKNEEVEGDE